MPDDWLTTTVLIIATMALAALAALALTWIPAILIKRRQLAALRTRCRGKLALTYDDGPDPLLTSALVELLDRHHAKASFFLVGFRAQRSPQMCELLRQAGHQLGCHTHMHRRPWKTWPWVTAWDVISGYRSMARWIAPDAAFRPPFGKMTTWSWLAALWRGAPLSWWTHNGRDTQPALPEPACIARQIAESGGAVVLMHSHDRGIDRHRYVLALTEQLLIGAQERGLQVCTMAELLD